MMHTNVLISSGPTSMLFRWRDISALWLSIEIYFSYVSSFQNFRHQEFLKRPDFTAIFKSSSTANPKYSIFFHGYFMILFCNIQYYCRKIRIDNWGPETCCYSQAGSNEKGSINCWINFSHFQLSKKISKCFELRRKKS